MVNENKQNSTLFNDILLSLLNNSWVYGGTIFTGIIIIYLSYMMDKNLQGKHLLLGFLSIIFFLMLLFYFLYNRQRNFEDKSSNNPPLNIFTDDEEKIKEKMGIPLYNFFSKVTKVLGSGATIILLGSLALWAFQYFSILQNLWSIILFGFLIISTLSIIYVFFKDEIDRIINNKTNELNFAEKIMKFFMEFIFLIPCLFVIFLDIIKYEIKSTIPIVWVLLIIEILIVLAFFIIPVIFSRLNIHDGQMLLRGPVYLNQLHRIGSYQSVQKNDLFKQKIENYKAELFKDTTDYSNNLDISINNKNGKTTIESASTTMIKDDEPRFNIKTDFTINNTNTQKFNYKYNYGISFFIYLNPQPINTSVAYVKDTTIFDYASKPKLVFNGIDQELKFICKDIHNLEKEIYSTKDFDLQKWIHIAVNYYSGTVDIFIDGQLRASETGLAPFMEYDKIFAGSNEGINGGIKDVLYFNEPLSQNKIQYLKITS